MRRGIFSRLSRGLTLMEMLAVLGIISVVIGLTVVAVFALTQDSDISEFTTNAKSLEEGAHLYYRDNGVYPIQESTRSNSSSLPRGIATGLGSEGNLLASVDDVFYLAEDDSVMISERSFKVIQSELLRLGFANHEEVARALIEEGRLAKIDLAELSDYTRVDSNGAGVSDFIIVDRVDDVSEGSNFYRFGYANELSGYVFSQDVLVDSRDTYYSGAYRLTYSESLCLETDSPESCGDIIPEEPPSDNVRPYRFTVENVELVYNASGSAFINVDLSWENRFVDTRYNRVRPGYEADRFRISGDHTMSPRNALTYRISNMPYEVGMVLELDLYGIGVSFNGSYLDDNVNNESSPRSLVIDVDSFLRDGPGDGGDPGQLIDFNFGPHISAEFGGIYIDFSDYISSVVRGDNTRKNVFIKMKEAFRGSVNDSNERTFVVNMDRDLDGGRYLIPKSLLSRDFRENPFSEYSYILEFYYKDRPCVDGFDSRLCNDDPGQLKYRFELSYE